MLLNVLLEIEPEKRSSFIKATLMQALVSEKSIGTIPNQEMPEEYQELAQISNGMEYNGPLEVEKLDTILEDHEQQPKVLDTFTLEDLFNQVSDPVPIVSNATLSCHKIAEATEVTAPWDNLLRSVIGKEEDASVIAALRNSSKFHEIQTDSPNNSPNPPSNKSISERLPDRESQILDQISHFVSESKFDTNFNIEALRVKPPIPSPNLVHLMNSIIGAEEDETIIQLIKSSRSINDILD